MNTLLFTAFMMMNPSHAPGGGFANRLAVQEPVRYNSFNFNFQVSVKLRFDGKKRRDRMRIVL